MGRTGASSGRFARELGRPVLALALVLHAPGAAAGGVGELVIPDVPYLSQPESLCGGAALAMVLRYWGVAGARPEDFARALDREGTGIPAEALVAQARASGLRSFAFQGEPAEAARHLEKGRPVIALVELAPGRRHYVVLLAWRHQRVLLHDPASGPFRVMPEAEWLRSWRHTRYWALLVIPEAAGRPDQTALAEAPAAAPTSLIAGLPASGPPAADSCSELVLPALALARGGDLARARQQLDAAAAWCPSSSAPLREKAALEFRGQAWAAAASLAAQAVARDPRDGQAWRLLATSRFLAGEPGAALEAWNQVSEPRLDVVHTLGLDRTPVRTLNAYLGMVNGDLLTPSALRRAERRVRALPALQAARVGYRPMRGGRAQVEAAVVERPAVTGPRSVLLEAAVLAASQHSLGSELVGLTSRGDTLSVSGGWQPRRLRGMVAASAPRALGLPGVVTVEGLWDEQSYRPLPGSASPSPDRESRLRASLALDDWWSADLRGRAVVAVDAWRHLGRFASLSGELERRLLSDRLALAAGSSGWWSPSSGSFYTASARIASRLRVAAGDGPNLLADLSYDLASSRAPRALWQGAGTGSGRELLLRAHALSSDGIIGGPSFGRELLRTGVEADTGLGWLGPLKLRGGVSVDVVRVLAPVRGSVLVDVGAGLSLRPPSWRSSLRLDLATPWGALRPRFSAGWRLEWPFSRSCTRSGGCRGSSS